MKRIILMMLVSVFLLFSVVAHAASPIFITRHVHVDVEDGMVYAEAVSNISAESCPVAERTLLQKTGEEWEQLA